MCAVAES
jgi:hypothetical protein